MMTAQEAFDAVARHLENQGGPSVSDYGWCLYDNGGGRACAAAPLASAPEGLEEGCAIGDQPSTVTLLSPLWLAEDMQRIHDDSARLILRRYRRGDVARADIDSAWLAEWRLRMRGWAEAHGLDADSVGPIGRAS